MSTIEELVRAFDRLPPEAAGRWSVHEIYPGRLYLTRDSLGRHSLFVVGDRESFGRIPRFRGVAYGDAITVLPGGATVSALRFTTGSLSAGNRVMAHIAYELVRLLEDRSDSTNGRLLDQVRWCRAAGWARRIAL